MRPIVLVLAGIALAVTLAAATMVPLLRVVGPALGIPFTVECVVRNRVSDGALRVTRAVLSKRGANDLVLAQTYPDRPFATCVRRILDVAGILASVVVPSHGYGAAEKVCGVSAAGLDPTGQNAILGYPVMVTKIANGPNGRFTFWRAPRLGCFSLRIIEERRRDDGSWYRETERDAVAVHANGI